MKKWLWLTVVAVALVAAAAYEWRYSADMQGHIDDVNRDIESASMRSTMSRGLIGSLGTMRDEADVAGEIFQTHEYVHTIKDEMLARRIKQAVSDGITVGGAIRNVLSVWSRSVDHPERD